MNSSLMMLKHLGVVLLLCGLEVDPASWTELRRS